MSLLQQAAAIGRMHLWQHAQKTSPLLGIRLFSAGVDASSSETHDDFKPKVKSTTSDDINTVFEKDIKSHDVFLYMKGVPEAPQCGFSRLAVRIMDAYGVHFGSRNVLDSAEVREGIKKFSNWPTIPQVFVKGEFVGGSDILMTMHESGELEKLLGPIVEEQQKSQKK